MINKNISDTGFFSEADASMENGVSAAEAVASEELTAQDIIRQAAKNPEDSVPIIGKAEHARWYIVHTYSGFEQRVEATIREMMRSGQDKGLIHEVVVPVEQVIERRQDGRDHRTKRKFYPGYIMLHMTMTDYSWHLVQNIPRVTGFIGGKTRPAPMKEEEANKILSLMRDREENPRPKFSFDSGEIVQVTDGPFSGFNGKVEEVNYDRGTLKVSVSIFGRDTPVELDFTQVQKR